MTPSPMLTSVTAMAAVTAVAVLGAFARRRGWMSDAADRTLLALSVNVLFPCLIFATLLGNPGMLAADQLALPPAMGCFLTVLGFAVAGGVAWVLAKPLGLTTPAQRRTFAFCVGMFNYGYVPIPLVKQLFLSSADPVVAHGPTLAELFVFNVGVDTAMWAVGVPIVAGGVRALHPRKIFSPPVMAILLALAFNLSGLWVYVPSWLVGAAALTGEAAIPLGVLLTGATIADVYAASRLREGKAVMAAACVLRLAVLPAMFLAIAATFPMRAELARVMVVQAAMPAAVFPIVLARAYGGDVPAAVRVVIGTTLVSLITIPLWLAFGLHWLGLPAGVVE